MSDASCTTNAKALRVMFWTGWLITLLIAGVFAFSAATKLMGGMEESDEFQRFGLPDSIIIPLAVIEIVSLLLYLYPRTSVLGAILLTGYMGGAICTHWRIGDQFVPQIIIGVLAWLGVYLRCKRLRALIPLR